MFPIRTEAHLYSKPVVTGLLVAANLAVFLGMTADGPAAFQRRIYEYGLVPAELTGRGDVTFLLVEDTPIGAVNLKTGAVASYATGVDADWIARALRDVGPEALASDEPIPVRTRRAVLMLQPVRQKIPAWLTTLTSMFMHASWIHVLGNLWFLWLFGAAVEDALGKLGFLVFYLATGFAATAAHVADDVASMLPSVGASGAISGAMGGFLMLFPRARVLALGPLIMGGLIPLPAFIFLGFYLLEQVVMSIRFSREGGGVAWWAHIGGFLAGMALVRFLPLSPPWRSILGRRGARQDDPPGYAPYDDRDDQNPYRWTGPSDDRARY
jgi:membrane associated rhomboid family serine protease